MPLSDTLASATGDKERFPSSVDRKPFSSAYIENTFLLWFKLGRPRIDSLQNLIPKDENDKVPSNTTLNYWKKQYDWEERADFLDAEVRNQVQGAAVMEKVEMLRRHSTIAVELEEKSLMWIRDHEPEKFSDAVNLLFKALEIEKTSKGIPEALEKIAKMSDTTLQNTIQSMLNKTNDSPVVNEGDNFEEGEFNEVE